jgi:hypothetical protein
VCVVNDASFTEIERCSNVVVDDHGATCTSQWDSTFPQTDVKYTSLTFTSSSGGANEAVASVATTQVGKYTMTYVTASSHDPSVTSDPVDRIISIVDTVGPAWTPTTSAELSDVEVEASITSNANEIILAAAPSASDDCGTSAPTRTFMVTQASATENDDLTIFYCGQTSSEGSALAATAARLVTSTQNFDNFGTACGSYTIEWDAVDDAGIHSYLTQTVHVRDTTSPVQDVSTN